MIEISQLQNLSLASFVSDLIKARMRILNFFLNLSPVQYEQVYWIFLVSLQFFPDILFLFFKKNVGTLIVTSDPLYAGERYDTSPPVEHLNNTITVFIFYM